MFLRPGVVTDPAENQVSFVTIQDCPVSLFPDLLNGDFGSLINLQLDNQGRELRTGCRHKEDIGHPPAGWDFLQFDVFPDCGKSGVFDDGSQRLLITSVLRSILFAPYLLQNICNRVCALLGTGNGCIQDCI